MSTLEESKMIYTADIYVSITRARGSVETEKPKKTLSLSTLNISIFHRVLFTRSSPFHTSRASNNRGFLSALPVRISKIVIKRTRKTEIRGQWDKRTPNKI